MAVLGDIEPKRALFYFEEISKIPHGSRNTKAISDYVAEFARSRGLRYLQDDSNNIIVFKNAAAGYENSEPVILQGHLDMVCEKDSTCDFNFEKDPLVLEIQDGKLGAKGTTLGGDDGVAVCFMLALLDDDSIKAPALECVFTVDEEIGMLGAAVLDLSPIKGRRMINLDHGEEGSFLVGCAGGVTACCHIPIVRSLAAGIHISIEICKATGGHSGEEINKQRANTNVLMGRLLFELSKEFEYNLFGIKGGLKDNAIPRDTKADIIISKELNSAFVKKAKQIFDAYKKEYEYSDPNLDILIEDMGDCKDVNAFDEQSTNKVTRVIYCLPAGVQKMSYQMPELVQTSLNMGILVSEDDEVSCSYSVRSSVKSEKAELCNRLEAVCKLAGASVSYEGDYPAWEYVPNSKLSSLMSEVYFDMYGKKPKIGTIHAGLECGIFSAALNGLDCVSIGPDMFEIHTTRERLDIKSTERTWDFLVRILERLV